MIYSIVQIHAKKLINQSSKHTLLSHNQEKGAKRRKVGQTIPKILHPALDVAL